VDFSLPAHRTLSRGPIRLRWRGILTILVVAAYIALTLAVIFRSPILSLDTDLFKLDLRHSHPAWRPWVKGSLLLGQRGPATLAFLPVFLWLAWRRRTTQPLVALVTSLILLNASVGVVKLITGRVGPRQTHNTHDIFVGGNIYPSGHVSNAVVLYGLMAMLSINHRKVLAVAAAVISVTVGMGTIYLDTHWFSDVMGGWFAGALVLLVLPSAMPTAQRWADALVERGRRRFGRRQPDPTPATTPQDSESRSQLPGGTVRPVRIPRPPGTAPRRGVATRRGGQSEKATPVSSEA
jgi:membrane-associated phospholipid phosphatase